MRSWKLVWFILFCIPVRLHAGTSALWGTDGEAWSPTSRLPDFSHAGYHGGDEAIPNRTVTENVKDYGATGDGTADDLAAFNDAINACPPGGVVLVPKGMYRLDGRLKISKSGITLRGEGDGPDGTTLYFTKHLTELLGGTDRSPWRYGSGGLLWVGKDLGQGKGSLKTTVTANASRGSSEITVSNAGGIAAGSYWILRQTGSSFLFHLQNDAVTAADYPGGMVTTCEWIFKVKSVSDNRITLTQPLRFDVRTAWGASIYAYDPVQEVGIEDLCIETPDRQYKGHHQEDGYNGLAFVAALNCWGRNLTIRHAENGCTIQDHSKHCQVQDLVLTGPVTPITEGPDSYQWGHHGFCFLSNSFDNMLTDYQILDTYVHDISLEGMVAGNVVRRGTGMTMCLDHHRRCPFENLFCDLHMGDGVGPYTSSGKVEYGPNTGVRETFWNLRSDGWQHPPQTSSAWLDFQMNIIPCSKHDVTSTSSWLETVEDIEPGDLWVAQVKKRGGMDHTPSTAGNVMMHPKPGSYKGGVDVYMQTITQGAQIRYTTDGSEPIASSALYEQPVWVLQSSIIKARAFKSGMNASPIESRSYSITPVITLEAEDMEQLSNYVVDPLMGNTGVTVDPALPVPANGYGYQQFIWGGGMYDIDVYAVPENDGAPQVRLYIGGNDNLLLDEVVPKDPSATDVRTDRMIYTVSNVFIQTTQIIKLKGTSDGGAGARVDKIVFKLLDTPPMGIMERMKPAERHVLDDIGVYPNPAADHLNFDLHCLPRGEKLQIRVTDVTGGTVAVFNEVSYGQNITWDTDGYKTGVYFYSIAGAGAAIGGRILVKR